MKSLVILAVVSMPLFVTAQMALNSNSENHISITKFTQKGIQFEQGLTWEQVKVKAQAANKYIFIDCYATWCQPCKMMDVNVYPNDSVGQYINARFVSLKLQMDSNKKDDSNVKMLYITARNFEKEYKIKGLPSYLFFSPEGKVVHKDMGTKDVKEFVTMAADALDPDKQILSQIDNWRQGKLKYNSLPALANKMKEYREDELALGIAKDYMHNYLEKLEEKEFMKKENFLFIHSFAQMLRSSDKVFWYYYNQAERVNAIMENKNYSNQLINYIIFSEEITPELVKANKEGTTPDWKVINKRIRKKLNTNYAKENLTNAKVMWYRRKRDWNNYIIYLVQQMDMKGFENGDFLSLNGAAWDVFKFSNNPEELQKAVRWTDKAIQINQEKKFLPTIMDTKANLLYKLGRVSEAITLYEEIVKLNPSASITLEKMKKGEVTWPLMKTTK